MGFQLLLYHVTHGMCAIRDFPYLVQVQFFLVAAHQLHLSPEGRAISLYKWLQRHIGNCVATHEKMILSLDSPMRS
jgi:hypothetical protein